MKTTKTKPILLGVMLLAMAMFCIVGCNKPEDPNNGGNGGDNNGGSDTPEPGQVIDGPDLKTFTVNGVSFDMVKVEGGTFWMGAQSTDPNGQNYDEYANEAESPVHQVALSDYYIGKYEVSQELWQAVMGTNPSHFQGELLPVENVGPNSIKDFLNTLNARLGHETNGLQFRLPTEAQWEFAAKGGKESHGYTYSGNNNSSPVAWYSGNSGQQTHPIGSKEPNELFLYDMSGNVFEWCNDYAGGYVGVSQTDPIGPSQEFMGDDPGWIIRGGSWKVAADYCKCSIREAWNKGESHIGFRLVLSGTAGQATVPGPRTGNVSEITTNSAHVSGALLSDGGSFQTEWGFCFGTSPDLASNGTKIPVTEYGQNHGFSATLPNLQSGTKYYVCAYAKNTIGTGYGEAVEFTTKIEVTTNEVTNITYSSAMCGGNVPNGGQTVSDKGICWNQYGNPTIDGSQFDHLSAGQGSGSFTKQINGLNPNTTYHVRAYAIVDNDVSYGNEVVFTTALTQVPTVQTVSASCRFVFGGYYFWDATGKIISDGGESVGKIGFLVSIYPYPTLNGVGHDYGWSMVSNPGIGNEFNNMDGELLDLNTTYYVRAYAINDVGVGYGEVIQIHTEGMPSAVIQTNPVTDITSTSAVCGGNVSTTGYIAWKGVCWGTSPNPEANYEANNTIVAPNGSGPFSVTITGLMPNTTYYVRACAFGDFEGNYGENQVFTTLP